MNKKEDTKASRYVKAQLKKLAEQFPVSTIRYRFDDLDGVHWVDLDGSDVNALNEEQWGILRLALVNEFESIFDADSLILVREGSLVRVTNDEADESIDGHLVPNCSLGSWESVVKLHAESMMVIQQKLLQLLSAQKKKSTSWEFSPPKANEFAKKSESVLAHAGTDSFCDSMY